MLKDRKLTLATPIPLTIEPGFILLLVYIAWVFADGRPERGLLAAFCAAVSILLHELGHALTVRSFGFKPRMSLVIWGGETHRGEGKITFKQEAAFIAAGPLTSFALAGLGWLAISTRAGLFFYALNLVWGLANSLPLLPLDGGQLARMAYLRLRPKRTFRDVHVLSAALALGGAFLAGHYHQWEFVFLGLFLMFTNFQSWQNLRFMSDAELRPEISVVLDRVVELEKKGETQQALDTLLSIRSSLGARNTCALAIYYIRLGRYKEALAVVESLHAAHKNDWSIALLTARCHAGLGDAEQAARWIKVSLDHKLPAPAKTLADCPELQALKDREPLSRLLSPLAKA